MGKIDVLVEKIVAYEERIRQLYLIFAGKFALFAEFWSELAKDAEQNAFLLGEFAGLVIDGDVALNLKHISEDTLDESIKFVEKALIKAENNGYDAAQALLLARAVENELLESEIFIIFTTKIPELQQLFGVVNKNTLKHYEMLSKKCADCD